MTKLGALVIGLSLSACSSSESAGSAAAGSGAVGGALTGGSAGLSSGGASGSSSGGTSSGGGGNGGTAGMDAGGSRLIVVDSQHPAWLAYEGGGSHFLCAAGDPEGFLYRGSRNADGTRNGDQLDLIAKLAPTGANGIYMIAVRSHGGDGTAEENPFVDSDPAKGLDPELLDQWETWFAAMDAAGIVIQLFVYDDSASVWNTGDQLGAEEKAFLEALVDRFEHHDHLVWVIAEEYSEKLSVGRASAIAATIRAADAKKHVIGVHQLDGLSFDFASDPEIDQFTIQYNVATSAELHAGMVQAFGAANGGYNLNLSEAAAYGTGATARKKSWATALGGAYVMVLGMDIASSAVSDLEDCGRLKSFMESTRFAELTPHDELAAGGTEYVLAKPGELYIAYASALAGELGVQGISAGTWTIRFFDPVTAATETSQQTLTAGEHSFAAPSGFGSEVALYLEKQ